MCCSGWDPITGLGSPKFSVLGPLLVAAASPTPTPTPTSTPADDGGFVWSWEHILIVAAIGMLLIGLTVLVYQLKKMDPDAEEGVDDDVDEVDRVGVYAAAPTTAMIRTPRGGQGMINYGGVSS